MPRNALVTVLSPLAPLALVALCVSPAAAQHGDLALWGLDDAPSVDAAPATATASLSGDGAGDEEAGYDEYEDFGDYDDFGEDDFCGDGGSSYGDAYDAFDEGDYDEARALLVDALLNEDLYEERMHYLMLLGQVQLRLDELRHAAVNFRRALAADPASPYAQEAHVGLAVAYLANGQRRRAQSTATTYTDESCGVDDQATVACYGAFVVLATSARDLETQAKAREAARRVLSLLDEYARDGLAYYETTFDVASWPVPARAAATFPADPAGNAPAGTVAHAAVPTVSAVLAIPEGAGAAEEIALADRR